jgi:hypothetical protein
MVRNNNALNTRMMTQKCVSKCLLEYYLKETHSNEDKLRLCPVYPFETLRPRTRSWLFQGVIPPLLHLFSADLLYTVTICQRQRDRYYVYHGGRNARQNRRYEPNKNGAHHKKHRDTLSAPEGK